MLVEHEGQAQFRADAVRAGDKDRFLILAGIQCKEAAEAAEVAENSGRYVALTLSLMSLTE